MNLMQNVMVYMHTEHLVTKLTRMQIARIKRVHIQISL